LGYLDIQIQKVVEQLEVTSFDLRQFGKKKAGPGDIEMLMGCLLSLESDAIKCSLNILDGKTIQTKG
jgi:hypothetical protein